MQLNVISFFDLQSFLSTFYFSKDTQTISKLQTNQSSFLAFHAIFNRKKGKIFIIYYLNREYPPWWPFPNSTCTFWPIPPDEWAPIWSFSFPVLRSACRSAWRWSWPCRKTVRRPRSTWSAGRRTAKCPSFRCRTFWAMWDVGKEGCLPRLGWCWPGVKVWRRVQKWGCGFCRNKAFSDFIFKG